MPETLLATKLYISQVVIVLDDYQVIDASQIHEGMTFLLDHLPTQIHFVVTTRSDPALPLHLYRSRGQLVEIRLEDLRFSTDEVSSFVQNIVGVSLSASDIATLEDRTEGWAAGLHSRWRRSRYAKKQTRSSLFARWRAQTDSYSITSWKRY